MGHLQLEWVRSGLQLRACGRLSVEGILKQCSLPPPSQVSMKCWRRCIHFMHGSIWPVTIPPPPSGKSKITSLWFCKVHVFSRAVYTMAVACEQALLFGRAKQAPQQRASEQQRGELAHRLWWLQTSRLSIFKEKCRSLWESGWRGITYQKSVFKGIF